MAVPAWMLADGENVLFDLRPHVKVLLWPVLSLLLTVTVASFLAAVVPAGQYQAAGRVAVLVVAVLALARSTVVPFLRWRTTHYVVTDRRVLVRTGILARRGRDVPLSRINDITFSCSLLERLLRCGSLVVESAGERGQVVLHDVPDVEQVQRRLYQLVEALERRS